MTQAQEKDYEHDLQERVSKLVERFAYKFISHGMNLNSFHCMEDIKVIKDTIQFDKKIMMREILNI